MFSLLFAILDSKLYKVDYYVHLKETFGLKSKRLNLLQLFFSNLKGLDMGNMHII